MPKQVELSRSEFAEAFLYLNGHQLSLDDYPHLRQIYNINADDVVLHFSRQTAKSTTLANIMIANSALIPHFKTLYVAPTVDQTKVFSHDRVNPVMEGSPFIKEHYLNASVVQNVFMKQMLNGSRMYLRYALLSADRLRGYSADMNLFDECQDLRADIIPIIRETMSRSMHKKSLFSGTPKRTRGTLADIWNRSTQSEYTIKCEKCNKWNILGEDNIGKHGIICKKCGGDLENKNGQWVSTYSDTSNPPTLEGYRVCLLHFAKAPWVDWQKDVLEKMEHSSKAIFYNESLALPYDDGVSPVKLDEIIACCDSNQKMGEDEPIMKEGVNFMGIDYGPVNSERSYTLISVWQPHPSKEILRCVYTKRFVGKEADYAYIHRKIPELMQKYNVKVLAADYGMGEAPNSEIRNRIGYERVIAYQHMPNQKDNIKWNAKMPAYTLSRSVVMNKFFELIKHGKLQFPRYKDFQEYVDDILNIQVEYDEARGTSKYINIGPDDFVHSSIFAIISLEMATGRRFLL